MSNAQNGRIKREDIENYISLGNQDSATSTKSEDSIKKEMISTAATLIINKLVAQTNSM